MKIGDVVKLKSGGPNMTVMKISSGYAICHWFDQSKACKDSFAIESLEIISQ